MRMRLLTFSTLLFLLLSALTITTLYADGNGNNGSEIPGTIVYLDLDGCDDCQAVKNQVISVLESEGYHVIIYDIEDPGYEPEAYFDAYGLHDGSFWTFLRFRTMAPAVFAGEAAYVGKQAIINAYNTGELQENAAQPLLETDADFTPHSFDFWTGLALVLFGGLLDGVNPCAIAMLLMFISVIGFAKNRKLLIVVSLSYILGIMVTYFIIGVLYLFALGEILQAAGDVAMLSYFLYGGFALLCIILFGITFYDFWVTRNEDYEKVKNQLPKGIHKLNKKIMERFTRVMETDRKGLYKWAPIIFFTVLIAVIVAITEFACTGQLYILVLSSLRFHNPGLGISPLELFYLLVFNVMFVLPLILIALFAIKYRSTNAVANFVRERLPLIKFLTSMLFLFLAIVFILLLFDVSIFGALFRF